MLSPEVARFINEMLARIRREFFANRTEKQFHQERTMLIQAFTYPARWMNRRGARLPASGYRRILGAVIDTIKRHGNEVKFRRFSLYFFKAVQEHMTHHGEDYYYAAKVRPVGSILPAVRAQWSQQSAELEAGNQATAIMAQMNRILRSPGGRRRAIRNGKSNADALDLFATCKPSAKASQDATNCSQTFAKPADSGPEFLKPRSAHARDS